MPPSSGQKRKYIAIAGAVTNITMWGRCHVQSSGDSTVLEIRVCLTNKLDEQVEGVWEMICSSRYLVLFARVSTKHSILASILLGVSELELSRYAMPQFDNVFSSDGTSSLMLA